MLKKLRRRFVAISMLIVSVVLACFYVFSCAMFFVSVTSDLQTVLKNYATSTLLNIYPRLSDDNGNTSLFSQYSGSVCVVNVSKTGSVQVLDISRAYLEEDELALAVPAALEDDGSFGHIQGLNLFYYKTPSLVGTRIAFASSRPYFAYLKTVLFDGGILLLFATGVIFLISRMLAKVALKPVEKAWLQQKNFIADASHELKTPLTVILTNGNILQAHKDDTVENQMKWIDSTNEEAAHMKDLVDKLLMLAKTDNMRENKMFTAVDISELAMKFALQFEPVAFEQGVLLHTDIESSLVIKGDTTAVNQIIHILLDNAVKYAGRGGEVTLSLKKRQNYIYLSAMNTGKPISEEDLPHIFERFYRSDKARTVGSGYGLGLSICKNLVELHRADISVSSSAEEGTVFTVKFKTNTMR